MNFFSSRMVYRDKPSQPEVISMSQKRIEQWSNNDFDHLIQHYQEKYEATYQERPGFFRHAIHLVVDEDFAPTYHKSYQTLVEALHFLKNMEPSIGIKKRRRLLSRIKKMHAKLYGHLEFDADIEALDLAYSLAAHLGELEEKIKRFSKKSKQPLVLKDSTVVDEPLQIPESDLEEVESPHLALSHLIEESRQNVGMIAPSPEESMEEAITEMKLEKVLDEIGFMSVLRQAPDTIMIQDLNQFIVQAVVEYRNYYEIKKLSKEDNQKLKNTCADWIEDQLESLGKELFYETDEGVNELFQKFKITSKLDFKISQEKTDISDENLEEWVGHGLERFEKELLKKYSIDPSQIMERKIRQISRQYLKGKYIKDQSEALAEASLANPENAPVVDQLQEITEVIEQSGHPEASEAAWLLKSQIKGVRGAGKKINLPSEEELAEVAEELSDEEISGNKSVLQLLRASAIASPLMLAMVFIMFIMGNLKTKPSSESAKSVGPGLSASANPGGSVNNGGGSGGVSNLSDDPAETLVMEQEKQINDLNIVKGQVSKKLSQEKQKNTENQARLKKANQSIEDLQKQVNDGEANKKSMEDQIKKKEAANVSLKQEVKSERDAKENAQKKVTQLTSEKERVEKQLQSVEHQKKQVDNKLKKTQEKLDSEKQMNKKKLRKLERQLKKLQKKNTDLQKKQQKLTVENEGLKGDLKTIEKDLRDAQAENIDLNQKNERLKSKLTAEKEQRHSENGKMKSPFKKKKQKKSKPKNNPKPQKTKVEKMMEKKMQKALQESKEKMFPPGTLG